MRGRKPTPDGIKLLQGTYRPDRANPDAPEPVQDLPECPDWVPVGASRHFDRLVGRLQGMGYASESYTEIIVLASLTLWQVEILTTELGKWGHNYETLTGAGEPTYKAFPEVGQLADAQRRAQSLLAELGLSPASSAGVKTTKPLAPPKSGNRFARFGKQA